MNLARLDLVSLRLVVLCAESGSLSGAAPRTAISISAASYKLRCLEDLLGQQIFIRSPRGLVPTEAGNAIIDTCKQMIALAHELVDIARSASGAASSLRPCHSCGASVRS